MMFGWCPPGGGHANEEKIHKKLIYLVMQFTPVNFSGSSSSSASTPASNGSSSNGLSLPFSFPNPLSSPNPPSPESASSNESNESPSSEAPKAGSLLGVSSFSLYLVSSSKL